MIEARSMLCACFRADIAIPAPNAILAEPVVDAIATLMFYTAPGRCHKRRTLCNRRLGRPPSKGDSRHQRHQHFEHLLSVPRRPKRSRTSRRGTRRNSRQRRPWAPPVFHARHPTLFPRNRRPIMATCDPPAESDTCQPLEGLRHIGAEREPRNETRPSTNIVSSSVLTT